MTLQMVQAIDPQVSRDTLLDQTGKLTYENTEKYIDVKGVRMHYHEAGEEHPDTIASINHRTAGAMRSPADRISTTHGCCTRPSRMT